MSETNEIRLDESAEAIRSEGFRIAGQSGWNNRNEAWAYFAAILKGRGLKADAASKRLFFSGWQHRRRPFGRNTMGRRGIET